MQEKYIKHQSLSSSHDLLDICKPLQKFNIDYFGHALIDKNNKFSCQNTHPEFLEEYLKNKLYNFDLHTVDVNKFGKFIIWNAVEVTGKHNQLDYLAYQFGLKYTCTIVENDNNGLNLYHFSSSCDSPFINQVYVQNQDLLKLFVQHFKENVKQSSALMSAYNTKYEIEPVEDYIGFILPDHQNLRNEFVKEISNSSSTLCGIHLSKREMTCLKLYVEGMTAKEIAATLSLSYRTVQNYIQSVKDKMGTTNKTKLVLQTLEHLNLVNT
jgi:DNA-binding CsgD family transcriptional regulator